MTTHRPVRRFGWRGGLRALLVSLCGVLALGCSDNGGGGGMMPAMPCMDFTTSAVPSPGTVVPADGTGSTCDLAVVDLIVTDVNDLFGARFTVNFDPAVVALTGVSSTGSVLGPNVDLVLNTIAAGQVSVGITRRAPASGVNVVGGQRLVRLTFARLASTANSSGVSFTNESLLDSSAPPQPIPGIPAWAGGSLVVTTN